MSHVFVLYAKSDHKFARQLAVQIEQRGIQVWPVPNAAPSPEDLENARVEGLESATHILGILPADDADITDLLPYCEQALAAKKHVLAIVYHQAAPIPDHLKKCRVIDFEGQFLLAFEELSDALKKTKASTRPLTVEHPPPISKPGLMPIRFPSERCWREDRLRVNYTLPIILTEDELQTRLPAFLAKTNFDLTQNTSKRLRGRRKHKHYTLFDPRRAQQTLTIRRKRDRTQVYYRMTRLQVYHWFPAHYHVLDREAAALYRYLATGYFDPDLFEPVNRQAQRARATSWGSILLFWLLVVLIIYLIAAL